MPSPGSPEEELHSPSDQIAQPLRTLAQSQRIISPDSNKSRKGLAPMERKRGYSGELSYFLVPGCLVRQSVTHYLSNYTIEFSEIWYVDASQ